MRYLALQLLLLAACFSATANMSGAIDQSGSAHLVLAASLPGAEGREVMLNVSGPSTVVVRDRSGLILPSRSEDLGNYTIVYATVPVDYLEYQITSDSFTGKSGDSWEFELVIGLSENISEFNSSVSFPQGTTIRSTNGAVRQDGDSLSVLWSGTGLDPSKRIHLHAGYDLASVPAGEGILPFIVVLAFLVLAYLLARTRPKRETLSSKPLVESIRAVPPSLEESSVFKTLDETDKEILREIQAQEGKTTQARLYTRTHVPKATLSRRLASLENRGIIKRSKKGNRKLVSLTDLVK